MAYLKISKKEAYYIGITMWGYLYNFPEIDYKYKLPRKLWNIVRQLYFYCPCCAVFYNKKTKQCHGCPLENNCIRNWPDAYFRKWQETTDTKVRKAYAKKILDRIIERGY